MAAKNKPAGIRSLVYGMGKGKVRIEGLSVIGTQIPLDREQELRRMEEIIRAV